MTRRKFFRIVFLTAVLLLALFPTRSVHASAELRKGIGEMARSVKQLLDGRSETEVVVGAFTGPANLTTSAGPGIQQILSEELQKLGITVKRRARLGIKGEYLVIEVPAEEPADQSEDRRPKVYAILLKGTVADEFGKVVTDFSFKQTVVKGEAAFAGLIGIPVSLPPTQTQEERDRQMHESFHRPQTFLTGTRISASPDGKLAVEVLINNRPRQPKEEEGLAYLTENIKRGETYAVRLINDTKQEMAAEVLIDGRSMFQFSELRQPDTLPDGKPNPKKGQPLYSSVIVPAGGDVVIKGWHRTNERSTEFKVTEYADTAGAGLNQTGNLGTLTVHFRASWPKDQKPPADEPAKTKSTTSGDGTGFGKSFEEKFKEVQRTLGVIRSSVSVHYTR